MAYTCRGCGQNAGIGMFFCPPCFKIGTGVDPSISSAICVTCSGLKGRAERVMCNGCFQHATGIVVGVATPYPYPPPPGFVPMFPKAPAPTTPAYAHIWDNAATCEFCALVDNGTQAVAVAAPCPKSTQTRSLCCNRNWIRGYGSTAISCAGCYSTIVHLVPPPPIYSIPITATSLSPAAGFMYAGPMLNIDWDEIPVATRGKLKHDPCVTCDAEWCGYLDAWHGDPGASEAGQCIKCREAKRRGYAA